MDLNSLQAAHFEKSLLDKVDHPNVIKDLAYFESNSFICMVTELMTYDLRQMLKVMKGPLQESQAKTMFQQMLLSVQHCH